MGARPYTVALVWTRWTGAERGAGVEEVAREVVVSPTPLVQGVDALGKVLAGAGVDEAGTLKLSGVSGRYTEEQLSGKREDGSDLPANEQFYWEVRYRSGKRRRFVLKAAPEFQATSVQWVVALLRASEDRWRSGEPAW